MEKTSHYHCAAVDLLRPSVFYISLETLDDDIGANSAPGAPRPSDRLQMIEALIGLGHKVCVGVNPVVPQWIPDPELMVMTLHKLGVSGIWVQSLHLSGKQIKRLRPIDRRRLGEEIIEQAKPKNRSKPEILECLSTLRNKANELGMHVYDSQQRERSDYFEVFKEVYPNRYPLMQDFVNHCWDAFDDGGLIYYSEWEAMMLESLPDGIWPIGQHIGAVAGPTFWSQARDFIKKDKPNQMTYAALLRLIWRFKESVLAPINIPCISWAGDFETRHNGDREWFHWLDDDDMPIMVFNPVGDELWKQVDL